MTWDGLLWCVTGVSTAIVLYHHIAYPIALRQLAAWRTRRAAATALPDVRQHPDPIPLPRITIVVPAHNEERCIARKIANLSRLTYDPERLGFVIAFDGCTDRTRDTALAQIEEMPRPGQFRTVEFKRNMGKVAVLNHCIAGVDADIVGLSDVSAEVSADALLRATSHFANSKVGVVCARYQLQAAFTEGERAYWEHQTRIKSDEAAVGAPIGAHGAFYMFRRRCWAPLEPDTINDDFILPMRIVAAGFDAVYDDEIVAEEIELTTSRQDFARRVRIGAGNLQQTLRLIRLAGPRHRWVAFLFVSGKGLRPFIPFLGIIGLAAAALLVLRGSVAAAWGLFSILCPAVATTVVPGRVVAMLPTPFRWFRYFLVGYAASLMGAIQYLGGCRALRWGNKDR